MPEYRYKALLPDGTKIESEGYFESPEQLYYDLRTEGAILLEYKAKPTYLSFTLFSGIKRKEIAELLHQLSLSLRSGIPLLTVLEDLQPEIKNKKLQRVIQQIINSLRRGATVREAFARTKVFSPIVLSLIQIGEESGTLDKTLEEASQHLYRIEEIISQTKRALIYPLFVFLAMTGAFGFWIFFVLPQLLKVFKEMNIQLPLPTIILMKVVDFFLGIKLLIPIFIILFIVFFVIFYKHPKTQVLADKLLLKIPIYGRVKRTNFLAFFFEHFSLLLTAGLDFKRILSLLKTSFNRKYFQNIVHSFEEAIESGEEISSALREHSIFKPIDIRMVSIGEKTGRLDSQLKLLSSFYYEEVKNLIDQLTKILEPVVLTISGIIFLLIILAMIGPVYELISKVGQG